MSDRESAEVEVGSRQVTPEAFSREMSDVRAAGPDPDLPEREGLPPGYRMRADEHYVEELLSGRRERSRPRPAREAIALGPEGRRPSSEDVAPRDARSARVLGHISDDLASIQSAADMLAGQASPLARRVGLDLIRAHAFRAAWCTRAQMILQHAGRPRVVSHPLGAILSEVRDGLRPECRLNGWQVDIDAPDWSAPIEADAAVLVAGLVGAVLWALGPVAPAARTRIRLRVDPSLDRGPHTIEVQRDAAIPHAGLTAPAIDASPEWAADLGASIARAVAHVHGGDAVMLAPDALVRTVRLTLARGC